MAEPNILIVDDDAFMRVSIRDALADHPYQVREASDGEEALLQVQQQVPDLVILDLFMPHRSGLDTLQELRRLYPRLPVLVVTSFDTDAVSEDAYEKGATGFIGKPFHPVEMASAVQRLVGA